MKLIKRNAVLLVVLIILMSAITLALCYPAYNHEVKLTEAEIKTIREENDYKIIKENENPLAAAKEITFRERVQSNDTYAYCEVIAKPKAVETFISTGDPELDKKTGTRTMIVYTVKVIDDSEGLFNKGDTFTYCYGLAYQDISPKPEVGSRIVLPIKLGFESSSADAYSGYNGYYYITDDGYGIAAFEEETKTYYSGKTAENILKSLKKTDAERNAYLAEEKRMYEKSGGKYGFTSIEMLREQIKEKLEARKNAEK